MELEEIALIRHVQVEHNTNESGNDILCGRYDTPPTSEGIEQAEELYEKLEEYKKMPENKEIPESILNPNKIICTPMHRGLVTAGILYQGRNIIVTDLAAERTYGKNDGKNVSDVIREHGLTSEAVDNFRRVFTFEQDRTIPGAENLFDVKKRATELIKFIESLHCKNVALVSHIALLRMVEGTLRGLSNDEILKLYIPNCSPRVLEKRQGSLLYTLKNPTWGRLIKK